MCHEEAETNHADNDEGEACEGNLGIEPGNVTRSGHHLRRRSFSGSQRGSQRVASRKRGGDGESGGGPIRRLALHAAEDNAFDGGIQVVDQTGRARGRAFGAGSDQVGEGRAFKRPLAGENFVEN